MWLIIRQKESYYRLLKSKLYTCGCLPTEQVLAELSHGEFTQCSSVFSKATYHIINWTYQYQLLCPQTLKWVQVKSRGCRYFCLLFIFCSWPCGTLFSISTNLSGNDKIWDTLSRMTDCRWPACRDHQKSVCILVLSDSEKFLPGHAVWGTISQRLPRQIYPPQGGFSTDPTLESRI